MLNLTQHEATNEQLTQGAYEPLNKEAIKAALTFSAEDILDGKIPERARLLAVLAKGEVEDNGQVFIGGLPALMGPLTQALRAEGLEVFFAHSDRVSEDQIQPDGSTKKVAVFRHQFFYPAH